VIDARSFNYINRLRAQPFHFNCPRITPNGAAFTSRTTWFAGALEPPISRQDHMLDYMPTHCERKRAGRNQAAPCDSPFIFAEPDRTLVLGEAYPR
jgi:hypothetical protein